jgi:hypothetical protein
VAVPRTTKLGLAGGLALAALVVGGTPTLGAGDTFVVRSTGDGADVSLADGRCDADPDPGAVRCTLRAAIEQANADADRDRIRFRIGGADATGVKVIHTGNDTLDPIVHPLVIDGYSQPDSRTNTARRGTNARLRIVLDGQVSGAGLELRAPVTVRGLVIRDYKYGILVSAGSGSVIIGTFIGTNVAGTATLGNSLYGVYVADSPNVRIGGESRPERNLIGSPFGISIADSDGARIQGDLIGVTASGGGMLPGILDGISVSDSENLLIGGDTAAKANTIAHTASDGIVLDDGSEARIRRNSIHSNTDLAIDLGDDGVTPNDAAPFPPDSDPGANDRQNFPVITSARSGAQVTTIKGTLTTNPNRTFRIELFANPGGTDGARMFIGGTTVTTNAMGSVSWTYRPTRRVPVGRAITATATDLSFRWTSEVSAPRTVVTK